MAAKKTTKVEKATPVNSAQEEKLKALEHGSATWTSSSARAP